MTTQVGMVQTVVAIQDMDFNIDLSCSNMILGNRWVWMSAHPSSSMVLAVILMR